LLLLLLVVVGAHREYAQAAAVQLGEGLHADGADHVHGLRRQHQEPGLRQGQEILRLVLHLRSPTMTTHG